MYTIVILVLFTKIKCITSVGDISRNATSRNITIVSNGVSTGLGIWPLMYTKQNMVVSTLPLRLALNKLAVAADGPAKEELLTVLGVTDVKDLSKFFPRLKEKLQCLRESDLIMLNKLYVNHSDAVAQSFFADAFKNFGVQAEKISFLNTDGLVASVNKWVDLATFKRITNLLSINDVSIHQNMILVNAIHMKPTWETTFDARMSIMKKFRTHNRTSFTEARMMTAFEKDFFYYDDQQNKFQVLMAHLACDGCKITYFLPNEISGLPRLLKLLANKPQIMENAVKKLEMKVVNVRLPVMKIKTTMNWNAYLRGLGIKKIFDFQSSGLDSMSQGSKTNHFLAKAIQKVFLETDEFGVYRKPPVVPIALPEFSDRNVVPQFVADHPFFFKVEIEHNDVSYELLSGVFYNPD